MSTRDVTVRPEGGARGGRLVANVVHFARTLRAAGLPVGPGRVVEALHAVRAVGITDRTDFYWALHAVFVHRKSQREVFDQAFHVFWRNPRLLEKMMMMLLPTLRLPEGMQGPVLNRRLADALYPERKPGQEAADKPPQVEIDAALTMSDREVLRSMDFEQMSAEEVARAKAAIARLRLPAMAVPVRRFERDDRGPRIDPRATLRASLRAGPDAMLLVRSRRRVKPPPLVILSDISGSMAAYSRMLLHFAHTLAASRPHVHAFVFGTRLSNISRALREKDVDVALENVSKSVADWSGGTRIGACLHDFNRWWSRRVLAQGAVVLLVTDGLERDAGAGLEREIERLHKSCRRLVWLNPLLRYDDFAPRAAGIRSMLPHVDDFRGAHNIASLEALVAALGGEAAGAEEPSWKRHTA